MEFVCKSMEKSDFSACAKELVLAFAEAPWNEQWTYEQAYTRIDEIMSAPVSRGFVTYYGDEAAAALCGRIMTYLDHKEFWIDDLSVNPRFQGQGIGKRILVFAREQLKKEDIHHMVLLTKKGFPCVGFYEKNGFVQDDSVVFMSAQD